MTIVVDASMVVAAFVDDGPEGSWADDLLAHDHLAAPHHLPMEVADILRRAGLAGDVSGDTATLAMRISWRCGSSCTPMPWSPSGRGSCAGT